MSTTPQQAAPPKPDLAGTFAVYLFPDGSAGLALDIQESHIGPTGPTRHHMPKFVVDLVLYGKRPNPLTMLKMLGGTGQPDDGLDNQADSSERPTQTGDA